MCSFDNLRNSQLESDVFCKPDRKCHSHSPTRAENVCPYTLRQKSGQLYFYKNVATCRTNRTEDVFTFNSQNVYRFYLTTYNISSEQLLNSASMNNYADQCG